jgi:hypothetical protein
MFLPSSISLGKHCAERLAPLAAKSQGETPAIASQLPARKSRADLCSWESTARLDLGRAVFLDLLLNSSRLTLFFLLL